MSKESGGLELSKVIFIGRTFDEYVRMFDLTSTDIINNKILDVPAGACSFTAVACSIGGSVVAADIAYYHSKDELLTKGTEDIHLAVAGISKVKDQYVWNYFEDLHELEINRRRALDNCVNHMTKSPDCYIPCILPKLPFENDQFDLTLSAHFLFSYADRLDFKFHAETIKEFLRVTKKEVRIFPLVDLAGKNYVKMGSLQDIIHGFGWKTELRNVPYEFQRNANSMLRIYKEN